MIQQLESRRHFNVTVTEMYPGFYEVQGTSAADVIGINVAMNDQTFTLDGNTYSGVSYIFVHGGAGDDYIDVISDTPGSIAASVTGDEGDDFVMLNFDGSVWAGTGNDVVFLLDAFQGEAYGEDDDDEIYIMAGCFDAEIDAGDGNDFVDCSSNSYAVVVHGGSGNDTMYGTSLDDQFYGDGGADVILGGGGNDAFYTVDAHEGYVDGGDGHDVIYYTGQLPTHTGVEETYGWGDFMSEGRSR